MANQVPMAPIGIGAPAASPSAMQLAQVDAQLASSLQTLGPNHPDIIALRQQRSALASAAAQERAAAARSMGGGGPSLSSQVSQQQQKVIGQRGKIDELRKIQASIDVLRDQYNKTMSRSGELSLEGASRESGVTLLGSAVAPLKPSSPKTLLILMGSIAVGLGLGVVISLGTEFLHRRVRGVEDVSIGSIPVIGVMPRNPARDEAKAQARTILGVKLPGSAG
jgi:uncharacterized protein involved in exopolysaccharide biosynthesis